ncbi:MAG: serine hydrolase domain-containing protein [Vulcanimicrobiaceae bacterium]
MRALQTPDAALRTAVGTRVSAAVLRIEHRGSLVFEGAYGKTRRDNGRPVFVDTRFDLASLTKIAVSTVALAQLARGRLALDVPLAGVMPEWRGTNHAEITLRMILAHDAGFASGADYRTLLESGTPVEEYALRRDLVAAPRERVVYSDLGFIALGVVLERVLGCSLETIVAETLAAIGVSGLRYRPPLRERPSIPATERDDWRGLVQGTVHDEKAHLMGGIAGHAGLFGDARSVARVAEIYLGALRGRDGAPVGMTLVRESLEEQAYDPIARRGLGWVLRTSDENSCGKKMSSRAFGHTGFTGTSMWCDPDLDLSVVLLTNAVHFERGDLRPLRAAVCDEAVAFVERCARSD